MTGCWRQRPLIFQDAGRQQTDTTKRSEQPIACLRPDGQSSATLTANNMSKPLQLLSETFPVDGVCPCNLYRAALQEKALH
jgi:hypothetical protein